MARAIPQVSGMVLTNPVARATHMRGLVEELGQEAIASMAHARAEALAKQWLKGGHHDAADRDTLLASALATMVLAAMLTLFSPNETGQTAIERFARRHRVANPDEAAALAALRQSRFRVVVLESPLPPSGFRARDLFSDEVLHLVDDELPPSVVGLVLAGRLCPLGGDTVIPFGPSIPLDDTLLALARQHVRPGKGLASLRFTEALYRHVVRHGAPPMPGRPTVGAREEREFPFGPDDGPVHALALALAASASEPTPAVIQDLREMASTDTIIDATLGLTAARTLNQDALAAAYETVALIQMETIERRAASGLTGSLDRVAAAIRQAIGAKELPSVTIETFETLRRRVRVAPPRQASAAADLDKVLGRIQALREKTVERGCTEDEALAAAEKVAELLDRYGLSLSEVDLKNQTCEGSGIETGRKRFGPIDACVPAIARFCDCRVWSEKTATGEIRYVFFGLPADVAGARYLYDLVGQAFETETERFKAGPLYAEHHTNQRRTATTSFQTGLAHGIAGKLNVLQATRETAMRTSSGRDLVPIKEGVVEEELAKLGMTFQKRAGRQGKRVFSDAYHAGRDAGDQFEYMAGIDGTS